MEVIFSELFKNEHQKKIGIKDSQVKETIETPDKVRTINFSKLELKLFLKKINSSNYLLVETKRKKNEDRQSFIVFTAYKIRPELIEKNGISDPLVILKHIVSKFGFSLRIGSEESKFILQKTIRMKLGQDAQKLFELKEIMPYQSFFQNVVTNERKKGQRRFVDIVICYFFDAGKYLAWLETGNYNAYVVPRSAGERADRLVNLRLRVRQIKNMQNYSEKDVRVAALNNCSWIIASAIMALDVLSAYEENRIPEETIRRLFRLARGDTKTFLQTYAINACFSFITMFQFQIENLMKNLLYCLEKKTPQNYYSLSKKLIKVLAIDDLQKKHDVLNLLAMIRNSFHSNGIHTKPSKTITINDHKFEFIFGKTVQCGEWGELNLAMNEELSVIEEILQHPKIRSLPDPVNDQYVPDSN